MDFDKCKVSLDIYDLCTILSTVGFVVIDEEKSKHKKTCGRNIEITCNVSGKKIFLESSNVECYCWRHAVHDDSEKWETSGTSGGKQTLKTSSSVTSWKDLPTNVLNFVEKNVESLVEIVRGSSFRSNSFQDRRNSSALSIIDAKLNKIKADCNLSIEDVPMNTSKSSFHINMLDKNEQLRIQEETTNMLYRSLDTLTAMVVDPVLPEPGMLRDDKKVAGIVRQNTYSVDSDEPQVTFPARTSSPVPSVAKCTLKKLSRAEKLSTDLANIIQETMKMIQEENGYPGLSPYSEMDVSKISQNKIVTESALSSNNTSMKSGLPYASSPNLSIRMDSKLQNNTNLKRVKSSSSYRMNISPKGSTLQKTGSLKRALPKKLSSIPSISPSFGSGRKSIGCTASGSQIPGVYKSIGERMSLGGASKELDLKKRSSLYSHIKPTIQRYTSVQLKK